MIDCPNDPVLHLIYQQGHNGYGQDKSCAICGCKESKLKVYTTGAERYTKENATKLGLIRCIDVLHQKAIAKEES